jgi:hypothetical protein
MSFADDINRITKKTLANADKFLVEVVKETENRLFIRSPVGDVPNWSLEWQQWAEEVGYIEGRFLSSWRVSVGEIDYSVDPVYRSGQGSYDGIEQVKAHGEEALQWFGCGTVAYISNSVEYAQAIENGTASPRQAPAGVVSLTAMEFSSICLEANRVLQV